MTTVIDREQLALEVARKTGIQLTPDDAILALIAAHDIVLDSYEKRWDERVDRIVKLVNTMTWIWLGSLLGAVGYFSMILWVLA